MSKITGYGRGWQEPRAATRLGRIAQRLREPATTTDYVTILSVGFIAFAAIAFGLTA